jgi:ornithine cyclodeaminase/alanine dehydrogenase-like protein (mu-crystallin family)
MQVIDPATTRRHLPMPALIEALRTMFVAGCEVPQRTAHRVGEGTLLLMPAWREGARLGVKTVAVFPGNRALGLPGLHSTYLLFDAATGAPLAQLDGDEITARRTAAASALAASYLARADAKRLLIVGAGRVAAVLAEAMRAVRPIDEVIVWNHRPAAAEALASTLRAEGWRARATDDLARAVAAADLVSTATLSTSPLIEGAWLCPGSHLDLTGSFTPQMREADAACFATGRRVFVDTDEALAKSGDLLSAVDEGAFEASRLQGTLAELCASTCRGRVDEAEHTVFKSVGSALEDLAAAELVWGAVQRESLSSTASTTAPRDAP